MAKTLWQHLLVPPSSCDQGHNTGIKPLDQQGGRNTGIIQVDQRHPNDGDNPAQSESDKTDDETQSYAEDNHSVDGISLAKMSIVTSPARSRLISTCQRHHTSNEGRHKGSCSARG